MKQSLRQLSNTRETLPAIEPSYTAQTIIINSPNCNIKYIHRGNIKFTTIEKGSRRHNRSLLQVPEMKDESNKNYSHWVVNKNLKQLSRKHKKKQNEDAFLDQKKRNQSVTKYNTKFTMKALGTIYSDPKLTTMKGDSKILKANSQSEKDSAISPRRKFVSPKQKPNIDRSQSPYLLSVTQKMESRKTITLNRALKNPTTFRANKYFFKESQPKVQTQKNEQCSLDSSMNRISKNMETVWNTYLNNELPLSVKSKYDIQSYINTVRMPVSSAILENGREASQSPPLQKQSLNYDFSFDEEKKIQLELKPSVHHRRKAYASNKYALKKSQE